MIPSAARRSGGKPGEWATVPDLQRDVAQVEILHLDAERAGKERMRPKRRSGNDFGQLVRVVDRQRSNVGAGHC